MSPRKKPPPTAAHLDNPEGGEMEIRLLEARIRTLEEDGEEAMSAHDLRNGYSPESTIKLIRGQIKFLRRSDPEAMELKASLEKDRLDEEKRAKRKAAKLTRCAQCWHLFDHDLLGKFGCPNCHGEGLAPISILSPVADMRKALGIFEEKRKNLEGGEEWQDAQGVMRPLYLLDEEIRRIIELLANKEKKQNAKNLDAVGIAAEISVDHITKQKKEPTMEEDEKAINEPGGEDAEEAHGAAKLFEQTSEIRKAIAVLRSEQRETRKRYKKAITTLEQGLGAIYDGFEDKQMRLFDEEPALAPDVQALVDHPSLM